MECYIALDKRSKKAQKAYYAAQRRTWENVNPSTRVMADGKSYRRCRQKQEMNRIGRESRDGGTADFFVLQEENPARRILLYRTVK